MQELQLEMINETKPINNQNCKANVLKLFITKTEGTRFAINNSNPCKIYEIGENLQTRVQVLETIGKLSG